LCQESCRNITQSWQTFVTGMTTTRGEFPPDNSEPEFQQPYELEWIFFSLAFVYFVDIIVRMVGLGKSFFGNGWNLFDVLVVTGIFATTVPTIMGYQNFILQQLQKLFLVSMAFKLVQKFDSLNQLFKTAM
jgi:Ion transport protein